MLSPILHLSVALSGVTMTVVGYPLWKGHIAPNGTYGFRTAQTIDNPALWVEVNRTTGFDLFVLGVTVAASCIVSYFAWGKSKPNASVLINVAVLVVGAIATAVHGFYSISMSLLL